MKYFSKKAICTIIGMLLVITALQQMSLLLPYLMNLLRARDIHNLTIFGIMYMTGLPILLMLNHILSIKKNKHISHTINTVRDTLLDKVEKIKFSTYISVDNGVLFEKINTAVNYANYTENVMFDVMGIISSTIPLLMIFTINRTIAIVVVIVIFLRIFILMILKPSSEYRKDANSKRNVHVDMMMQFISSIKLTRLNNIVGIVRSKLTCDQDVMIDAVITYHRKKLTSANVSSIVADVVYTGLFIYSIYLAYTGVINIEDVIILEIYIDRASTASIHINELILDIDELKTVRDIIDEILSYPEEDNRQTKCIVDTNDREPIIKLSNVGFSYDDKEILKDINMKIYKGETIGIVGASGSGKSTLVNLLTSLYDDYTGKIKLFNNDYKDVSNQYIRNNVSIVEQDLFVFNNSILNNITLFDSSVSENEIDRIINDSGLKEYVDSLPDGIHTLIGDNGVKLSGGQKQRIAIARSLLHKKNIQIYDEATSALDNISESIVMEAINKSESTNIIIAHRLTTVRNADRIYVLGDGKIVEVGNHNELMKLKGYYYNLNKVEKKS